MGRVEFNIPFQGGARDADSFDDSLGNLETELGSLDGVNFRPEGLDRSVISPTEVFRAKVDSQYLWESTAELSLTPGTTWATVTMPGSAGLTGLNAQVPTGAKVHVRAAVGFKIDTSAFPWSGGLPVALDGGNLPQATELRLQAFYGGGGVGVPQSIRRIRPTYSPGTPDMRWASMIIDQWFDDDLTGVYLQIRTTLAGMPIRLGHASLKATIYRKWG